MISKFFIKHPIIAIVISIVMVLVGTISMLTLSVAEYPEIVPPEILTIGIYPGADAKTVEQSVATPIESQMSGVDNMSYMYSTNASNGWSELHTDFDVTTNPNIDQILTQLRVNQASSQMPTEVSMQGVQVMKSMSTPLMLFNLISPQGTYDRKFLVNYGVINLKDELARIPGVGRVEVLGGEYSMRQSFGDGSRGCCGDPGSEQGQSGWTDRRRAHTEGPGIHLHGSCAGQARNTGRIRQYRNSRQSGWVHLAPEGCCAC
jgi:HAE1 family hydrophobic/amphiphilic exporter-1